MRLVKHKTQYFIIPIYDNPDGWDAFLLEATPSTIADLKRYDSIAETAIDSSGLKLCSLEIEMPIGKFLSLDAEYGFLFEDCFEDEEWKYLAATPQEIEVLKNKTDHKEICIRAIRFYGKGKFSVCLIRDHQQNRKETYFFSDRIDIKSLE